MGPLCTTDLQKACLLGYSLAQRFQLFMLLFFPLFVLLCLQCCTVMLILSNDSCQEISYNSVWIGRTELCGRCYLFRQI